MTPYDPTIKEVIREVFAIEVKTFKQKPVTGVIGKPAPKSKSAIAKNVGFPQESKLIHRAFTAFSTDLEKIATAKGLSEYINVISKKGHTKIPNLNLLKKLVSAHDTDRTRHITEFHKKFFITALHSLAIEAYNPTLGKLPVDTRAFITSYIPKDFIFKPDIFGKRFNPEYKESSRYMLLGRSKRAIRDAVITRTTGAQGYVLQTKGKNAGKRRRPSLFSLVAQRRGVMNELMLTNKDHNLSAMTFEKSSAALVLATSAWKYFKDITSHEPKTKKIVDIINSISKNRVDIFTGKIEQAIGAINVGRGKAFGVLMKRYKEVVRVALTCLQAELESKLGVAFEKRPLGYKTLLK